MNPIKENRLQAQVSDRVRGRVWERVREVADESAQGK